MGAHHVSFHQPSGPTVRSPDDMDEEAAAELLEELVQLDSVWQALAEAAAKGNFA